MLFTQHLLGGDTAVPQQGLALPWIQAAPCLLRSSVGLYKHIKMEGAEPKFTATKTFKQRSDMGCICSDFIGQQLNSNKFTVMWNLVNKRQVKGHCWKKRPPGSCFFCWLGLISKGRQESWFLPLPPSLWGCASFILLCLGAAGCWKEEIFSSISQSVKICPVFSGYTATGLQEVLRVAVRLSSMERRFQC